MNRNPFRFRPRPGEAGDVPSPPIEPEIDALLESERRGSPPADALDRVWARVAVSVSGGPSSGGDGRSGVGSTSPSVGWLRTRAATAVAAFALGGAAGAALVVALRPPAAQRVVYVERPAAVAGKGAEEAFDLAPRAPSRAAEIAASGSTVVPLPAVVSPARAIAPPASSASLAAERALLDAARAALSQGDAQGALASTEAHARRFARPQLAEEREALAIQALVSGGRYDDARARADRFRAGWPNSLVLPAVEASLASIP
jgi:hypothetical protein